MGHGFGLLSTGDIKGAQHGTKMQGNFHDRSRSYWVNTNNTQDVPGAQPMTLQKGITSDRKTNPLAPEYTLPGSKEVRENDVYGGSSMSKAWIAERKAAALAQSKSA